MHVLLSTQGFSQESELTDLENPWHVFCLTPALSVLVHTHAVILFIKFIHLFNAAISHCRQTFCCQQRVSAGRPSLVNPLLPLLLPVLLLLVLPLLPPVLPAFCCFASANCVLLLLLLVLASCPCCVSLFRVVILIHHQPAVL